MKSHIPYNFRIGKPLESIVYSLRKKKDSNPKTWLSKIVNISTQKAEAGGWVKSVYTTQLDPVSKKLVFK